VRDRLTPTKGVSDERDRRSMYGGIAAVISEILNIGAQKMPMIAYEFLKTFWPVLVGGAVCFIYWQIRCFRTFRTEKEEEFQKFLEVQNRRLEESLALRQQAIKDIWVHETHEWLAGELNERFNRIEQKLQLPKWDKRLYKL
jgi:hypothetical protein